MKAFAKLVNEWSPLLTLLALLVGAVAVPATLQGNIGNRLDTIQTENTRRYDELNRRFDQLQTENTRRYDELNRQIDELQTENTRRYDTAQTENNQKFDAAQAENNQRFDEVIRRFDTLQADNTRRYDELREVLRTFEGRISRLEERKDKDSE